MTGLIRFKRLDKHLVDSGMVATLPRARELIQSGAVRVNGAPITAIVCPVSKDHSVEISGIDCPWVSPDAIRLFDALEKLKIDIRGFTSLDLGAGVGGFTEVLLQKGAKQVFAVDKEFGLLDQSLILSTRVKNIYNVEVKNLTKTAVPVSVDLIISDIPVMDLTEALPVILALADAAFDLIVFTDDKAGAKDIEKLLRAERLTIKKIPDALQKGGGIVWTQKKI